MPSPEWAPTSADVAAEIPARVKSGVGAPADDFSTASMPSKVKVEALIEKSVRDVIAAVGTLESCTAENIEELRGDAKSMATIRTAMRVERGYFPEQIRADRSPYNALRDEYRDGMKVLTEAVAENCGGGGGGGESVGGTGVLPSSSFDGRELVGPSTVW